MVFDPEIEETFFPGENKSLFANIDNLKASAGSVTSVVFSLTQKVLSKAV